MAAAFGVLPRPFGRGLIEAPPGRNAKAELVDLPRPFGRGLIEARNKIAALEGCSTLPRPFGRGLIEAGVARMRSAMSPTTFRDRSVAASLKLVRRYPKRRYFCAFRDRSVAASLKRYGALLTVRFLRTFRDRSVAASLKLIESGQSAFRLAFLPRPFGRGLIEAVVTHGADSGGSRSFRDRSVAASLKLCVAGANGPGGLRGVLPRPFGRGLIEAGESATWAKAAWETFRDRSVAASLKPQYRQRQGAR